VSASCGDDAGGRKVNREQFVMLCECGCGLPTLIAAKPNREYGHVTGQPIRFIVGHSSRLLRKAAEPCGIGGCGKPARRRGWCGMHYERWRQHGDPNTVVFTPASGCTVSDCAGKHAARGYCRKHLDRFKRHGNVLGKNPRDQPETVRFWLHVNTADDCWLWNDGRRPDAYGSFHRDDGKMVGAHRFSYELANGPIPAGLHVLHSCDNPPCVNPAHLSVGTRLDNMRDMIRKGRARPRGRRYIPEASK
jgi:hypothetical protein